MYAVKWQGKAAQGNRPDGRRSSALFQCIHVKGGQLAVNRAYQWLSEEASLIPWGGCRLVHRQGKRCRAIFVEAFGSGGGVFGARGVDGSWDEYMRLELRNIQADLATFLFKLDRDKRLQ